MWHLQLGTEIWRRVRRSGNDRQRRTETTMTLEQVEALVRDKGIAFFLCSFVEMSGAPKAKLVPATHLRDMAEGSAGFAGFATGAMGQGPHDPDMVAMPDFSSTTILPWRKNIAWVASNIYVNGAPWPYCPRTVLSRYLDQVQREWGYTYKIGIEPEFHLVQQDADGRWRVYDRLDTLARP